MPYPPQNQVIFLALLSISLVFLVAGLFIWYKSGKKISLVPFVVLFCGYFSFLAWNVSKASIGQAFLLLISAIVFFTSGLGSYAGYSSKSDSTTSAQLDKE